MSLSNIEIDVALCRAFCKRPGETLLDAAERARHFRPGGTAVQAAALVLLANEGGDIWATMRAAHNALTWQAPVPPTVPHGPSPPPEPSRPGVGLRLKRCADWRCRRFAVSVEGCCAWHAMLRRRAAREASP